MKKILMFLLLIPGLSFAKSYAVELQICDMKKNCIKCHETIKITYVVNVNNKQVRLLGKDLAGKDINELMDKCHIADDKNWSCESAFFTTQINHGQVQLVNKTNSSLASSYKEVCLIK
jgi:hypothetical protein